MSTLPNSPVLDAGSLGNTSKVGQYNLLTFPSDLFEKGNRPQYMIFYANVVQETNFNSMAGTQFNQIEDSKRNEKMAISTSINASFDRSKRIDQAVALYIPSSLSHNYNVNWSSQETGTVGAIARAMKDPINAAINAQDGRRLTSFVEQFQKGGNQYDGLAKDMFLYSLYNTIGGTDLGRVVQSATKTVTNPHVEVLFDGVGGNRTFGFTYKFYPETPEDSITIKNIIHFFRFHMAPEITNGEGYGRFYRYPSTFDIEIMNGDGENPFITKIFTCGCTACDVTYNGQNWMTFVDGAPSEVEMRVSFVELEQITKEKIEKGY